jgi:protein involved in polysaccharide export with SLBB domain
LSLLAYLALFVLGLFGVVFSFANYPLLAAGLVLLILLAIGGGERRRAKARRERERARRRLSTRTS